jgi:hypothetical protein
MRCLTLCAPFGIALAAFLACGASATAQGQACPVRIDTANPIGAPMGVPSSSYAYEVDGKVPQTVDVSVIADTSGGWFTWDASAVRLTNRTRVLRYVATQPRFARSAVAEPYAIAASDAQGVGFPEPVIVHHLWIVRATTPSDSVDCDVPAFATASMSAPPTPQPDAIVVAVTPSPLPAQPGLAANATPTSAPFPSPTCAKPFKDASVREVMVPEFPRNPMTESLSDTFTVLDAVQVDGGGNLIAVWTYATSGLRTVDDAVMRAARRSSYTGGVSYCLPAVGTYLFRADFTPYNPFAPRP